jgi:hypothetical protein
VSGHARTRARERAGLTGRDRAIDTVLVELVEAAFEAGRCSKTAPSWTQREWIRWIPARGGRPQRFVWDEAARVCCVVRRARRVGSFRLLDGEPWMVVTVLVAEMGVLDGVTVVRAAGSARR